MTHLDWGLQAKTVIVTGATGAIGRAVAQGFAEAGAKLALIDLDQTTCDTTALSLGLSHRGYAADLRRTAELPALIHRIESDLGLATTLVNVAGIILRTPDLFSVTEKDWDAQHDINLKALFFLTQAFAKRLADTGTPGSVINYSSQGAMSGGLSGSVVYNATKGAITTMTRGMARSWAPLNIRVNSIAPGLVDTPMLQTPGQTQSDRDAMIQSIPMKRLGLPEDHVGATVFLASDMARYMTGAMINVSGGFLMY
ncbi:SDR family oxidoreductase [Tabrizicola sp.]|uniref:SDR family NAD(P)-dependent oxidoreductase n=1 Tax=Tabrizicola sp. TaxID=2005166 RepID=UPI00286AB10C|nr:SDR family oxidoreductase [Tabrizicola sp.]